MNGTTHTARAVIYNEEAGPDDIHGMTSSDDYDFALAFYQRLPKKLKLEFMKERLNELTEKALEELLKDEG